MGSNSEGSNSGGSGTDGVIAADDRVRIRPWRMAEAPRLFDILSRTEVTHWLGEQSRDPLIEVGQAAARIERWIPGLAPPQGCWVIESVESGVPAGTILIMAAPEGTVGELEVGWYLHPDAEGRGLATAAARLVVDRAFGCGVEEVFAQTSVDNGPSQAVCRRLGMTDLGEVDGLWIAGPSRLFVIGAR